MPKPDTTRRLTPRVINRELKSFGGLTAIKDYSTNRLEASSENLQSLQKLMQESREKEAEMQALFRAAADAAREAEWAFHNAILAMREVVKGQYGSDSDEAQAIGLKKKSDRKRPKPQRRIALA